jgi:hypothetical protein
MDGLSIGGSPPNGELQSISEGFLLNSIRAVPPKLSAVEGRNHFSEMVGTLSEEQAVQETKRCLKYDLEL